MPYSGSRKQRRYAYDHLGYRPLTDAAETRVHLKWLIEVRGLGMNLIAEETGLPYTRVRDIRAQFRGRYRQVRREDAAAILAYSPSYIDVPTREGRVLGASPILQGL